MNCTKCGLEALGRFCSNCGATTDAPVVRGPAGVQPALEGFVPASPTEAPASHGRIKTPFGRSRRLDRRQAVTLAISVTVVAVVVAALASAGRADPALKNEPTARSQSTPLTPAQLATKTCISNVGRAVDYMLANNASDAALHSVVNEFGTQSREWRITIAVLSPVMQKRTTDGAAAANEMAVQSITEACNAAITPARTPVAEAPPPSVDTPVPPVEPSSVPSDSPWVNLIDAPGIGQIGESAPVTGAPGRGCTPSSGSVGGYSKVTCHTAHPSKGLERKGALGVGSQWVLCQQDLGRANPVFLAAQTNSWWFWTLSDNGVWDWFPETALKEGASDSPANGIAVCD